jgi:hypothetical protein
MMSLQEVRILTVALESGGTGDSRSSLGGIIFRSARKGLRGTSTLKLEVGVWSGTRKLRSGMKAGIPYVSHSALRQ